MIFNYQWMIFNLHFHNNIIYGKYKKNKNRELMLTSSLSWWQVHCCSWCLILLCSSEKPIIGTGSKLSGSGLSFLACSQSIGSRPKWLQKHYNHWHSSSLLSEQDMIGFHCLQDRVNWQAFSLTGVWWIWVSMYCGIYQGLSSYISSILSINGERFRWGFRWWCIECAVYSWWEWHVWCLTTFH